MTSERDRELASRLERLPVEAGIAKSRRALAPTGRPPATECEQCNEPIDPRRLAAVPEATRCVDCASDRER